MDNGSSRSQVQKKIREWKQTKAAQRRKIIAAASADPNIPF